MADRGNDDERRRWVEDRARPAGPDGARGRQPDSAQASDGRHSGEGGRYTGGAPWGGRDDDRGYPPPDAARPRDDRPIRRLLPTSGYVGERHEWRPTELRSAAPLHDELRHDDRGHEPRGWLSRVKDEVRSRRGGEPERHDHRGVERRTVEPALWRDDDRRPDRDDVRPDSFDVEIADAVAARLGGDRRLDARFVEIAVYHGEVELTGAVLSKEGRRRAKHLAEDVHGVRDVDNHLRVEPWRFV